MYDLDKVLNLARYGVMAEHADYLTDLSKGACQVIVRNPYIDAATDAIRDERVPEDSIPPVTHQPLTTTTSRSPQQQVPISEAATLSSQQSAPAAVPRHLRAICTFCGKTFGHLGDYNKHRRRHTGERPYACDVCQRRFAHASNLQRHRRLHSGEKPFECPTCAKRFSRKDKLAAHETRQCCKPSATTKSKE
ncbi:zinc finger protein 2-like [Phymastichus coffea]|uniref:zinc finger protein 2-like n=1 Tax=Phymastichus coffea TaxID=108790 RepID=UPI00273BC788|nr:zinc finger protein 2-like [Phymastichus coffea]